MSGKRKDRRLKLVVQWYGRTVGNRREAVCWMCLYDLTRGQRYAISFVVTDLDMLKAASDPVQLLMVTDGRWRSTWRRLRDGWRAVVLGKNWCERRRVIRVKRYTLARWDEFEAWRWPLVERAREREAFIASLERDFGPTPEPIFEPVPDPPITGIIRDVC